MSAASKKDAAKVEETEDEVTAKVVVEGEDEEKEGAPATESPESPAAPPEFAKASVPDVETPEAPAAPPVHESLRYGDIQSGGILRASPSTYTSSNLTNDPASMTAIDTGVATAPVARPTTFTPTAGYAASTTTNDTGVGSTTVVRPPVHERSLTATVYIDPGVV